MNMRVKKLVTLALLGALAYVVMVVGRIPVVLFLKYDPKDVIITIGGFLYGPLSAALVSVVVSLVEMLTVSDTGPIGAIMNVLSTCAFACTASAIYMKKRDMTGAAIGLVSGLFTATAVMLLWNYIITPIYMSVSRETVEGMLVPIILPFNLLKGGLNAAFTVLLYKPVVTGLRKARLMPESEGAPNVKKGVRWGAMLISLFVIATCVLVILIMQGKL